MKKCKDCKHYSYQTDRNDDVVITFCNHPKNTDKHEGNTTENLCPIIKQPTKP